MAGKPSAVTLALTGMIAMFFLLLLLNAIVNWPH